MTAAAKPEKPAKAAKQLPPLDRRAVELKMDRAMTSIICSHPFYACILLNTPRVETLAVPTMGVDGKKLYWNPYFVQTLDQDEVIGVLAHEVGHIAALHPWRRMQRKPRAWNIACDKVVNNIVIESGLKLPKDHIPPVPGKSAEELYSDDPGSGKGKGKQNQKGSGGNSAGGGQGQDDDEGDDFDPGGCGGVMDPTNDQGGALTQAEYDRSLEEAKVMVQQALNTAKKAGKLPAGLARLIDETLEPKIPWREILSRFIDSMSRNDYSWTIPNRKFMHSGIIFPSLRTPSFGRICMGCDTSGSIDQQQLKEICSEILGCLDVYAERGDVPELTVAWFDHAVYVQTVSDADELRPKGGGGTSFRVVFEWLEKETDMPRAIVMVTDGHCDDYGEAPPIPVLWVLTQANNHFKPPFGELACTLNV
jgi:predicted metal-dependent peptidase